MNGPVFATSDFLLAAMITAFGLYAVAMCLARCAPVSRSRTLVQRVLLGVLTMAGGFASFVALLSSVPVAMMQWQWGVLGAVAEAGCLVFGLSVVHWAVMRRSEVVWFCDLEEQVRVNELRARWRKEERELVRTPVASGLVPGLKERGRKRARVYF